MYLNLKFYQIDNFKHESPAKKATPPTIFRYMVIMFDLKFISYPKKKFMSKIPYLMLLQPMKQKGNLIFPTQWEQMIIKKKRY